MTHIKVIIPAYNEADSIAQVIHEIPTSVSEIIVVNNNSSDDTASTAEKASASVFIKTVVGHLLQLTKTILIFIKPLYTNA